jgi:hypothetical protein
MKMNVEYLLWGITLAGTADNSGARFSTIAAGNNYQESCHIKF